MFKKVFLIVSIALGLVISGCASYEYESRPFFYGLSLNPKVACSVNLDGSIHYVFHRRLCDLEQNGY